MTNKVIIYLNAADINQSCWFLNGSHHKGDLSALTQAVIDKEVIVVVPARDVLLISTQLPKMNRSRLLQALPFALEEQLIDDVEDLHFAAGVEQADGQLPVAIVAKEKMQQWLTWLQQYQIKPTSMIGAVFALPIEPGSWSIALLSDGAIVRENAHRGYGCDVNNLSNLLAASLETTNLKPEYINLNNYTVEAMGFPLPISVHEVFAKDECLFLEYIANNEEVAAINLLQGPYITKNPKRNEQKVGRRTVYALLALLLVVIFLQPIVSIFLLQNQVHAINDKIAVIYKRHFPNSTSIVAPKQRLQDKWQQMSASGSDSTVLMQIGFLTKAVQKVPAIKIKRFDYQANTATVELIAANNEDFTSFTDYLTQQGLTVKQQNANLTEGRINASIQISAN